MKLANVCRNECHAQLGNDVMDFKDKVMRVFEVGTISRHCEYHPGETFRGDLSPVIYCLPREKISDNFMGSHFN